MLALLLTILPTHTYVARDCFSTGAGAAVGGFIGGVLLTAAIAGVVAVAVFCRVKRELSAMSRCVSKSYQHMPHIQVHTYCYAHIVSPHTHACSSTHTHTHTHTHTLICPLMHGRILVYTLLYTYILSYMNWPILRSTGVICIGRK